MQIQANAITRKRQWRRTDPARGMRTTQVQQCCAQCECIILPSEREREKGSARASVLSSRALSTLAGAQRIQAGMEVSPGDLCSAALPLSGRNTEVRGQKRMN